MADKPLAFPWLNPRGPPESTAIAIMDPGVAEQCKRQLVQQHALFKQQTAALASAVQLQVQLANKIPVYIEENGSSVRVWNPLEAVKAEIVAAQHGQHATLLFANANSLLEYWLHTQPWH